jgi:hypothetical protein
MQSENGIFIYISVDFGIFHENFPLKQEIRRTLHRIYNFGFLINGSLLWTITLIWRQIRFTPWNNFVIKFQIVLELGTSTKTSDWNLLLISVKSIKIVSLDSSTYCINHDVSGNWSLRLEIKSKFQSDVLVEVPSSRTIWNLITKLFHGVKIKPGRCKDNWAKSTQRYYGLSWCKEPWIQTVAGELKIYKSVDEGSNYYLDKYLAPKNLGLKVGCFTENIYFNHSPVTIYKITGEISHKHLYI